MLSQQMKRTRYQYENNTMIDFPSFTRDDIVDYETLCVWRLKDLYNQIQKTSLSLNEKQNIQISIDEYFLEHYEILSRMNLS